MVSKKIVFIKVPRDMPQSTMVEFSEILKKAFAGTEFGFFIVPDKFDALAREEVIQFLEHAVKELKAPEIDEEELNL